MISHQHLIVFLCSYLLASRAQRPVRKYEDVLYVNVGYKSIVSIHRLKNSCHIFAINAKYFVTPIVLLPHPHTTCIHELIAMVNWSTE